MKILSGCRLGARGPSPVPPMLCPRDIADFLCRRRRRAPRFQPRGSEKVGEGLECRGICHLAPGRALWPGVPLCPACLQPSAPLTFALSCMPGNGLDPRRLDPLIKSNSSRHGGQCPREAGGGLPGIEVWQQWTLSLWASGWGQQSQRLATGWTLGPVHRLSVGLSFLILAPGPAQLLACSRH